MYELPTDQEEREHDRFRNKKLFIIATAGVGLATILVLKKRHRLPVTNIPHDLANAADLLAQEPNATTILQAEIPKLKWYNKIPLLILISHLRHNQLPTGDNSVNAKLSE